MLARGLLLCFYVVLLTCRVLECGSVFRCPSRAFQLLPERTVNSWVTESGITRSPLLGPSFPKLDRIPRPDQVHRTRLTFRVADSLLRVCLVTRAQFSLPAERIGCQAGVGASSAVRRRSGLLDAHLRTVTVGLGLGDWLLLLGALVLFFGVVPSGRWADLAFRLLDWGGT